MNACPATPLGTALPALLRVILLDVPEVEPVRGRVEIVLVIIAIIVVEIIVIKFIIRVRATSAPRLELIPAIRT